LGVWCTHPHFPVFGDFHAQMLVLDKISFGSPFDVLDRKGLVILSLNWVSASFLAAFQK